jgi:hypothetical protein
MDFIVTGYVGRQKQSLRKHALLFMAAVIILMVAVVLKSPVFAPVMNITGMFIVAPFLCYMERKDVIGWFSRYCVYLPFLIMVYFLVKRL